MPKTSSTPYLFGGRSPRLPTPLLVGCFVLGCLLSGPPTSASAQSDDADEGRAAIRVLAASSLTGVVGALEREWESRHETPMNVSFGGSSRLATQLSNGARADVFLSADRRWVDVLEERDLLRPETRRVFASNRLVWVVSSGGSSRYDSLEAVRRNPPSRLALGGPNVPAGTYARDALQEAKLWGALRDRAVSAANVKRALQWVALGEAESGIVYATDARASGDVDVAFALPEDLQPKIAYEGAVPRAAAHPRQGEQFLQLLTNQRGRSLLEEAGFSTAGTESTRPAPNPPPETVDPWSSIGLSVVVGLGCLVGGLLPAILLGWLLARRRFRGKSLVATVLLAPLALPPVVTGFVLLRLFGRSGLLGAPLQRLGIHVPFTTLGAGLAAFVVSFPLYLLTARSAFELVDRRYEEISLTLGYAPRTTFWKVTIPLALPGIAAGALLAFARAVGEFGATAVLAGNVRGETQTIPLAIYTLLESPSGYDSIWFLVGVSLALSLVAVLGFEWFNRRQRRRNPSDEPI